MIKLTKCSNKINYKSYVTGLPFFFKTFSAKNLNYCPVKIVTFSSFLDSDNPTISRAKK